MGIAKTCVTFQNHVPDLFDICSKITDICSLPVSVLESGTCELHELDAKIAFECAQGLPLEIYTYQPGAIKFYDHARAQDDLVYRTFAQNVEGADELPGTQTVYLQGYLGQEPTLMLTTQIALETLGGTSINAITDDDRQKYGRPISESELTERCEEIECQTKKTALILILMLPLLIPMWILGGIWFIIKLPFSILKTDLVLNPSQCNDPNATMN
ncbi:MAG: hypothetical protein ACPGVO_07560 [Spirulinaceae cyanobacterium]